MSLTPEQKVLFPRHEGYEFIFFHDVWQHHVTSFHPVKSCSEAMQSGVHIPLDGNAPDAFRAQSLCIFS